MSLVLTGSGYQYPDMELDHAGELFLADMAAGADGLRVFDASNGVEIGGPIDMGLPPFDIVMPAVATAVETAPQLSTELRAWPNPFNPAVTLRAELLLAGPVDLKIFDSTGRCVAEPARDLVQPAGSFQVTWRPEGVASGVYLARLETAAGVSSERLVFLK